MELRRLLFIVILLVLWAMFVIGCVPQGELGDPAVTAPIPTQQSTPTAAVDPVQTPAGEMPQATESAVDGVQMPAAGGQAATIPEGWKTETDMRFGYSFSYPAETEICTTTEYSRVLCKQDLNGGPTPPVFYATVILDNFDNADASAYNYIPVATLEQFRNVDPGSSIVLDNNPEYGTFTRMEDQTINGKTFTVIENRRVWEMPQETKDKRAFVSVPHMTFLLGGYYRTPQEYALFEQILATFQMIE